MKNAQRELRDAERREQLLAQRAIAVRRVNKEWSTAIKPFVGETETKLAEVIMVQFVCFISEYFRCVKCV